jgi:nucleotidyltransferase/DNA polymerase involved in DNA repair
VLANQIREILAVRSPLVEPKSIDEGFLDLTVPLGHLGSPEAISRRIPTQLWHPHPASVAESIS